MVLVQGTAHADDAAATGSVVHVRPERVFVWPAATSRPSPSSTARTSRRSARATTRSPRSAIRRPEGGGGVWDERLDDLGRATRTLSCPSSAPTGSRSPSASRSAPSPTRVWCASRPTRSARRSSPAWPACARTRPVGAASTSAATSTRTRRWVLRPHRVADPDTPLHAGADGGLTVAVTGPTGEIGKPSSARWSAHARSGASSAWRAGPSTPRPTAGSAPSTAAATCSTAPSVEGLVEGADVVVHLAFIVLGQRARPATSTSRARATSSRPRSPPARSGSSTRARWRPTGSRSLDRPHHRGRPGARPRAPPVLRPQGRGRGRPRRRAERRRDRRLRLPPVHRRRPRRARVHRPGALAGPAAGPVAAAGRHRSACSPTRASPSSSSTTTTSPPRCAPASWDAESPAPTTSPPPARSPCATSPTRSAIAPVPMPEDGRRGHGRDRRPAALPARRGPWLEALRRPVLMDTAKARRELRWRPRHDARETLARDRPRRDLGDRHAEAALGLADHVVLAVTRGVVRRA